MICLLAYVLTYEFKQQSQSWNLTRHIQATNSILANIMHRYELTLCVPTLLLSQVARSLQQTKSE